MKTQSNMSAEGMIRQLFLSLENTLHERLSLIEQILVTIEKPKIPLYDHEFVKRVERLERLSEQRVSSTHEVVTDNKSVLYLESRVAALEEQLVSTCAELERLKLKREGGNTAAELGPVSDLDEEVAAEEASAEEAPEEEAPEEEALELEELQYRGVTYYKDADNKVYSTDEEGAVIPEPIARWNGTKLVRI